MSYNILKKKITNKSATVAIIGLGYVGLPLSILAVQSGYHVLGFDVDKKKIDLIKNSKSYLKSINSKKIRYLIKRDFIATAEFNKLNSADIVIICVPTPINKNKTPNLTYIISAVRSIKKYIKKNTLIVLESTSYPGTTNDLVAEPLESKFKIGQDVFIGFSPERVNPGRNENSIKKIPKVVSGKTAKCLSLVDLFYKNLFISTFRASSLEVGEFSKLLENVYRAVNIGFINEMKFIAEKMNINIYDAILAAKTKPYGFRAFLPGPGIGGHCIPVDPYFLYWKAKKLGATSNFIKLSGEVNENVQIRIVDKIKNYFRNKNLKNKKSKYKILIVGISYKKNVDDTRESPAIKIVESLLKNNFNIYFYDNYVSIYNKKIFKKRLSNLNLKNSYFDASLILANHSKIDFKKIMKISNIIFDSRFVYSFPNKKVVRV